MNGRKAKLLRRYASVFKFGTTETEALKRSFSRLDHRTKYRRTQGLLRRLCVAQQEASQ